MGHTALALRGPATSQAWILAALLTAALAGTLVKLPALPMASDFDFNLLMDVNVAHSSHMFLTHPGWRATYHAPAPA